MWKKVGLWVIRYRVVLLISLFVSTVFMSWQASKVKLSYEFAKAIPTNDPRYQEYLAFREKFGDDGNVIVAGLQTDQLFEIKNFKAYMLLQQQLKKISGVEDVIGLPTAINLSLDSARGIMSSRIFDSVPTPRSLDSSRKIFESLPFYRSLMVNPSTKAYVMGMRVNREIMLSPERSRVMAEITARCADFEKATGMEIRLSGLPLIRTIVADRIQKEMRLFLFGSLLLSVLTLLLFFRSLSTMALSLTVVLLGVIWTVGILVLFGYKITLLTALIPSLVVVIGIPNCIYFLNKFHTNYIESGDKQSALVDMVGKMGVVTLFCNISAAIGFAVFALTKSTVLKEFGLVAGLGIMAIFLISLILLPGVLSLLPAPGAAQLRYLNNRQITDFLLSAEKWVTHHKKVILWITALVVGISVIGILKLKTVGFIVDDLPRSDKVFRDLKFFEEHFKGVMPLEILVDTKKPNGLRKPGVFERVDSLSGFIATLPYTNRPMSVSEGLRFFYQGFSGGNSSAYTFPNEKIVEEFLRKTKSANASGSNGLSRLLLSFMDSSRQCTRISLGMKDIGTEQIPLVLDTISKRANQLFDTSKYKITLTGTSITFLEGSRFIIKGLKESIFWAFLLIALCMLFLFRSFRILLCSLIPNVIPLVVTAGIMGWTGIPLKPSTVLVFSVALGIAIDITIRFLVNYRQILPKQGSVEDAVYTSIRQTGLSIIYTSLVLIAGFIIFCLSGFGGTFALGWLTSVTLLVATLTNIILLPVFIIILTKR